MLSRASLRLLKRGQAVQTFEILGRFVHSYVASDECILKPGEVYSFTDTGICFERLVYKQEFATLIL